MRSRFLLLTAFLLLATLVAAVPASARIVYTGNYSTASVSMFDTNTNQLVGSPIPVGEGPYSLAITPNGRTLYVVNESDESITVIDTATNQPIATIPTDGEPQVIAIAPNGAYAYVATFSPDHILVLDTQTNQFVGPPITVGGDPWGIAFSPDGTTAYVVNEEDDNVSVIDTATRQVVGSPIPVGGNPYVDAISPDGKTLYVANFEENTVSVIDTATRQPAGPPITVGGEPWGVAVSPDGSRVYVSDYGADHVSVIDAATRQVVGPSIPVGDEPYELALTPDGKTLYVPNYAQGGAGGSVTVIDTQTLQVKTTIPMPGSGVWQLAVVPDQSPSASFKVGKKLAAKPVSFDGSASSDIDGTIARFDWSFGDGKTAQTTTATTTHKYKKAKKYSVGLTVTDNEGCSVALVFTGRMAYCSGSAAATQTRSIKVTAPNNFTFGKLKRNPKNGTAKLQVKVPAAGKLVLSGKNLKKATRKASKKSTLVLPIKPKGKLAGELAANGKVKLKIKVKFSPTGGKPKTKGKSVKLVES
jgi:YVTN family beta-propeller protein